MALLGAVMGLAILVLLVPSLALIAVGIAIAGGADAASSVRAFSLRQRRTARAWFGRAFAVSMALNFSGVPIGSALAGPVLGVSTTFAVLCAAGLTVAGSAVLQLKIPATAAIPVERCGDLTIEQTAGAVGRLIACSRFRPDR